MRKRIRPLLTIAFFAILVTVLGTFWRTRAASPLAAAYEGLARIEGALPLELSVSPPVSTPGQTLTLDLSLSDLTASSSPEVIVQLPSGLSLATSGVPAGTTLNLQTNELSWLPLVSGNGNRQQVTFSVRVESADIASPVKSVKVTLKDGESLQQAEAIIWVGIPPQIDSLLHPPQVAVGQPFRLRADIAGSGPVAQLWDLGDGRRLDVTEPVVVYPAAGIYQVELEAANPLATVAASRLITVVPHPASQFVLDDYTPGVNQPIRFISESGGKPPLRLAWDFGDGTTADNDSPVHQYAAPGSYPVHLVVENDFGQSEAFWQVSVGESPVADLVIGDSVPAGQTISGQAFGDETVTLFEWDMGDGHTYEGEFVNHVYRQMGDYFVSMRASNDFGGTQVGRWVYVSRGTAALYLPLIYQSASWWQAGQLSSDGTGDPFALQLDPVELDEPFVLEPIDIPGGIGQAEQLFLYINEARRLFDLPPLVHIGQLSQAAQQHADDMATFAYTAHVGSDGSYPAERLLWFQYPAGYGGEATAWGFQYPYQAVEFWVNSPAHRRIILNQYATDVGAGFTVNYGAPNVWYWTAEFGNNRAAATSPLLRSVEPLAAQSVSMDELSAVEAAAQLASYPMISDKVSYVWNWPVPLQVGQRFVVYLFVGGEARPVAIVSSATQGTRYQANAAAFPTAIEPQLELQKLEWQVRLEDNAGFVFAQSERRSILLGPDMALIEPTPAATVTPLPSVTPSVANSPTPTPRPVQATPTARPTSDVPVLVTATPASSP